MLESHEISYINLFKEEYLARKEKNSLYSLRAFARQIDLTPAYVSMVFRGKRNLSSATALTVSRKLKWNRTKQQYFLNLLEFANPRSEESKEVALSNIQKIESANLNLNSVEIDTFEVVASWYYGAIMTLLGILKMKATTHLIAKSLKLNSIEVENALVRLRRLGLVKFKSKYWVANYDYLKVGSTPSEAIRIFHKQHLAKAAVALDEQPFNDRNFTNMTISVDPEQMELAKKKIVEFHYEMAKLMNGKKPSRVYQLSIQLFQLTQPTEQ